MTAGDLKEFAARRLLLIEATSPLRQAGTVVCMGLFRRRQPDLASLLERRAQLVAELEAVDEDAA